MESKTKKRLIITAKLLLAAVLLAWVLRGVHFRDYLVLGEEYGGRSVCLAEDRRVDGRGELVVAEGMLWWEKREVHPFEHFQPVGKGVAIVHPGLISCLGDLDWPLFIAALLCFPVSLCIVAYRLKYLLYQQDMHISSAEVLSYTFLGHLFNFVIPGMISGDLVKAWFIVRPERHAGPVLATMFVDRLLGLLELVLMASVMVAVVLLVGIKDFDRMRTPVISVMALIGLTSVGLAFILLPGLRKITRLEKLYNRTAIAHHFRAAGDATHVYRERPWILAIGLVMTIFAHLFYIGGIAVIGFSLDLGIPWYYYFVYLPLIYIIGAIPLTPGGVGLIENLYVSFFAGAVVAAGTDVGVTKIIVLAFLARIAMMAWGLPGLPVFVKGRKCLPPTTEIEEQLERVENAECVSDEA